MSVVFYSLGGGSGEVGVRGVDRGEMDYVGAGVRVIREVIKWEGKDVGMEGAVLW